MFLKILAAILYTVATVSGNPYAGGYNNCTWTAWQAAHDAGYDLPGWHNAGIWAAEAALQGYTVTDVPAKNSISVWSNHVGFVKDVSNDGRVLIEEGGASIGHREGWVEASSPMYNMQFIGYIYLPITEEPDEEVENIPIEQLISKAQNVNVYLDPSNVRNTNKKQKEERRQAQIIKEEAKRVTYVEQVEDVKKKRDEPETAITADTQRLLSPAEMTGTKHEKNQAITE